MGCKHIELFVLFVDGWMESVSDEQWRHDGSLIADRSVGDIFAVRCQTCGHNLSLGPSNDEPAEIQVEIRAAELAGAERHSLSGWPVGLGNGLSAHGWVGHERQGDAIEPDASYFAGYLARELATHHDRETRDADAWPWDVSRPIFGQYEEAKLRAEMEQNRRATWEASAPVRAAADELAKILDADDPGESTDPATKFGELAGRLVIPVDFDPSTAHAAANDAQIAALDGEAES